MGNERLDLPQGTLDVLILKALSLGPLHGWAVSERLQQLSVDAVQVRQGSLYPALHRLERRGLINAAWGTSENNRRARFYEITAKGRKQLAVEADLWARTVAMMDRLLEPEG